MSLQDPVADMLTRIRNAQNAHHAEVEMPSSKLKCEIARVLKDEGYVSDYVVKERDEQTFGKTLVIELKYYKGQPVIAKLNRKSRPGLKIYIQSKDIAAVPGFGISILSTSKGVMSHTQARKAGIGGEVLCVVA